MKTRSIIDLIDSVPSFYSSREGLTRVLLPSTMSRLGDSKLRGGAAGGLGELCLGEDGVCGGWGLCVCVCAGVTYPPMLSILPTPHLVELSQTPPPTLDHAILNKLRSMLAKYRVPCLSHI